ncbi:HAD family hydrolase [Guptibacillus spartinae]|uniref:HAD family hydrolase n=1 Tax=Guptibacillus spartinae TaxID=3025679 RepID=UPI0023600AE0|nr:HAD family hydrolase [Pseudalkalibacillus spartinae]
MDSIIFDLDGTIWDPIDTVLLAWNSRLKEHPQVHRELTRTDFEGTMGLQMQEISLKLFPYLSEEVREQVIRECCEVEQGYIEKHGGSLFPQVETVLKRLSNSYKLYIVSKCQDGYIESFYTHHQLENYFQDFENPGRTGLSKGENIQLIIERNNLTTPIYIGDTEGDLKAARYAKIPFIYAQYGFGEVSEYDDVIDSFPALSKFY